MVTVSADFFGWYSLANRRFFSVFQCLIAFSYGKSSISGPVANLISISNVSGVSEVLALTFILFCRLKPLSHATLVTGMHMAMLQSLEIFGYSSVCLVRIFLQNDWNFKFL